MKPPTYLLDGPDPFAPDQEWETFAGSLRNLPQDLPEVKIAQKRVAEWRRQKAASLRD